MTPPKASIRRLYTICDWLKASRPFNTRTLSEELQISRRTIRDDIEFLRSVGFPIAFDKKNNTYVLSEPYRELPWNALTATEVATLLVATLALEALGDSVHATTLSAVVERLGEFLPETMQIAPESLSRMLRFEMGSTVKAPLAIMEHFNRAINEQRVLEIHYHSNYKNERTTRDIEPYSLLCKQGRWYAIAYCRLRNGMRDFRLDRVASYRMSDEVFAISPDFDLDTYLDPSFGMHRDDRTYPVHIRFSAYQARWIQEEIWHETQLLNRRADGTLDLMMQATGLTDIARWVMSYGDQAEVISPPILRHRIAREARAMAAMYQEDALITNQEDLS